MNAKFSIAIGCDHAAFNYKNQLAAHLAEQGYDVIDMGCDSENSCHYPVFAKKVADAVVGGKCRFGILICGTGIGMSIAANKVKGIRAAVCADEYCTEMTRQHNDANILCMGARVIDYAKAEKLADLFLNTEFMGDKHAIRVGMISDIENGSFNG